MVLLECQSSIPYRQCLPQLFMLIFLEEAEAAVATLFGGSAAACFVLALIVFRQEQRDLLLNPLKSTQKEVHQDAIDKQGKGVWFGVGMWVLTLILGSIMI